MAKSSAAPATLFSPAYLTVRDAISYLTPHLSRTKNPRVPYGLCLNSFDSAEMILKDALFCLKTEAEVSLSDVRKARRGRWRLNAEHRN